MKRIIFCLADCMTSYCIDINELEPNLRLSTTVSSHFELRPKARTPSSKMAKVKIKIKIKLNEGVKKQSYQTFKNQT